jgi:glycosyltransferase involved in cell wall biosynthesis
MFVDFAYRASKSAPLKQAVSRLGLLGVINFLLRHFPRLLPELPVLDRPIQILGNKFPSLGTWNESLSLIQGIPQSNGRTPRKSVALPPSQDPFVTVIVSLYHSDQYLSAFIDNLTSQTIFGQCEVVIVSVQPSDSVRKALMDLESNHQQVKVVEIPERISIYQAWNKAILNSSAPLITNMNADDVRSSDSLEIQVQQLHADGGIDVVYQDVFYSLSPNLPWGLIEAMGWKSDLPEVTLQLLASGMNLPHNAPMWRRSLHEKIGLFDSAFSSAGDHDFWVRAAIHGARFAKHPTAHVAYYVNPTGMSTKINSPGRTEGLLILSKYKKFARPSK